MGPRSFRLFMSVWFPLLLITTSFSVDRRRLPGIWKLKSDSLPYEPDIRSKLKNLIEDSCSFEEILIKLNPDGSFKQCNEGYREGKWLAGRWKVDDRKRLVLALRRQYFGPQFDVLLEGRIDEKTSLKVEGEVQKGKYMYPQKHPEFFDSPLVNQEALGTFILEQSIASFSVTPVSIQDLEKVSHFERADFYGRYFIMTFEPIESKHTTSTSFKPGAGNEALSPTIDIRAMPVRFFANNTFQALGVNKILRGHFDITESDELVFEVSLFGNGRSVSGSVYSEGRGFTHEDKRSYLGSMKEWQGRLRVEGTVTFGTDMGSDARPEPVGSFLLTETGPENENNFFTTADDDYGTFE